MLPVAIRPILPKMSGRQPRAQKNSRFRLLPRQSARYLCAGCQRASELEGIEEVTAAHELLHAQV